MSTDEEAYSDLISWLSAKRKDNSMSLPESVTFSEVMFAIDSWKKFRPSNPEGQRRHEKIKGMEKYLLDLSDQTIVDILSEKFYATNLNGLVDLVKKIKSEFNHSENLFNHPTVLKTMIHLIKREIHLPSVGSKTESLGVDPYFEKRKEFVMNELDLLSDLTGVEFPSFDELYEEKRNEALKNRERERRKDWERGEGEFSNWWNFPKDNRNSRENYGDLERFKDLALKHKIPFSDIEKEKKRVFKDLVKKIHPDSPNAQNPEDMVELNQIWEKIASNWYERSLLKVSSRNYIIPKDIWGKILREEKNSSYSIEELAAEYGFTGSTILPLKRTP